jgi:DNA-binding CsgD family transcriptional regulator
MEKTGVQTALSPEGFLLLDSQMKPIYFNRAAAEILSFPRKVDSQKKREIEEFLEDKVRSTLLSSRSSRGPAIVPRFHSGKRLYMCRAFPVNFEPSRDSQPLVAVVIERGYGSSIPLLLVSEKFRLTTREQEVLHFLANAGLTTKEIAMRMSISPNTVKAFLRLIMVKMGVSTRSGIVGKVLTTRL